MYGYVEEGARGALALRKIGGMWCWHLTVPRQGLFRRRQRRGLWRRLQRAGVRCAVLPPALTEEAARWGIVPVAVHPLRRGLVEQLLAHFPPLQGKAVVLTAPFVTAEVTRTACLLAQRARYLELQTGQGSAALAQLLRRRFGLAAGAVTGRTMTVSFRGAAQGHCLCLGEDCAALQQVRYRVEGLEEADEQLLAALFDGGYLTKEEIRVIQVKSIDINA